MKFREIAQSEYQKFWDKSTEKSFLSAPEMSELKRERKTFYYAVFKDEKIIAAVMVWGTKKPFGWVEFYAPRGFLGDYSNKRLVDFFVKNLKRELKKKGGYVLRIEPNVEYFERDIDGKKVEGGYENQGIVDNLLKDGFRRVKYVEGISQITWEFVLPVKGKNRDEILNNMKSNTKRRLKQAMTLGIEIKNLKREEIKDFYNILCETADRKKFKARDLSYFERIYDLFHGNGDVQFVSAVIRPKDCIKKLQKQKKDLLKEEPKTIREKHDYEDALKSIEARIMKVKEAFGGIEEDEVTLSSGMFFMMQPEILHLAGGNVDKYMKLDGQYILQWEMIGRAIDSGYERYNFYGIPENIDTHPENYGVYEFKRGFGGKVVELIGEFELPLDNLKFRLAKILGKIRKII